MGPENKPVQCQGLRASSIGSLSFTHTRRALIKNTDNSKCSKASNTTGNKARLETSDSARRLQNGTTPVENRLTTSQEATCGTTT